MKRQKPSGAQYRKLKQQRTKSIESCKSFMKAFIEGSSSSTSTTRNEPELDSDELNLEFEASNIDSQKDDGSSTSRLKDYSQITTSTSDFEEDDSNQNLESSKVGPSRENSAPENESFDKIENRPTSLNEMIENKANPLDNDNCEKLMLHDIGVWPTNISKQFRDSFVMKGTYQLQNKDSVFPEDESGRSLHRHWFKKTLKNGEKVNRSWMCFSPSKKSLFCFCCTLFPQRNHKSSFNNETGFSTWRKLNPRVQDHENSPAHRVAFLEWKDLERALQKGTVIDDRLQQQVLEQSRIWRVVLERVIATVQTLAQQNLALRGHRESIVDDDNCRPGNFLALLKYLAKFDPVMRAHLQSVSENPGSVSYLSPRVQNEVINLLGEHVRKTIIASCKHAKYFGIMFDSTPDTSHEEQMSQIVRFVEVKQGSVEVRECFIDFVPIEDKTAEGIAEVITKKLEKDGLNFADCRGQSYDNQATMAGIHSGVQTRLLDLNQQAVFVPCDNHSLNLVGVHAAHVNVNAVTFFGTVERVYAFFSSSTHRWSVLKEHVKLMVKGHSDTRWSSKAEAVKALSSQLDGVLSALEKLRDTLSETIDTRQSASLLINAIERFDFVSLLFFWSEVLPKIDRTQKTLQIKGISFTYVLICLQSLQDKLSEWRENLPDDVVTKAAAKCEEWGVPTERRERKKRKMPGEIAEDVGLSWKDEVKRSIVEILDKLLLELGQRFLNVKQLDSRFGFLCNFEDYMDIKYTEKEMEELRKKCLGLAEKYPNDLNGDELFEDIKDIITLLRRSKSNGEELDLNNPKDILLYISAMGLEAYSTLVVALKLLLTIPVSVASCERSFSKLKLIQSYLRSTMTQERLTNLAILSIESDVASALDYTLLINEFASLKARKVHL